MVNASPRPSSPRRSQPGTRPAPRPRPAILRTAAWSAAATLLGAAAAPGQTPDRLPPVRQESFPGPWTRPAGSAPTAAPQLLPGQSCQVMVELADPPAAQVYARARRERGLAHPQAEAESEAHALRLQAVERALQARLTVPEVGARVLYGVQRAYAGVAVVLPSPDRIAAVRALPGVKAVHPLVPKRRLAQSSVLYLGAPSFWNAVAAGGLNVRGETIKVGVIDSGIDYVHQDFGGSGLGSDYDRVTDQQIPAGLFPNGRVKGGYDFAGDAYDASKSGPAHLPQPDPNPCDCSPRTDPRTTGHGTAVAGVLAGGGVQAAGAGAGANPGAATAPYAGPYGTGTPVKDLVVGPGIAPAADLYALRVFGCEGPTNLVTQAIDWALDPAHRLDVLNLSLGSDFGPSDDPDAVAADNAAAAGVVVVAAAGNGGDAYTDVASPGSGTAVISVAASYNDDLVYDRVEVTGPPGLASAANAAAAPFGPSLPAAGLTGSVVLARPPRASGPLRNADQVRGKICLVRRGGPASFVAQVRQAQQAGALAVLFVNDGRSDVVPADDGTGADLTIPAVMLGPGQGQRLDAAFRRPRRRRVTVALTPQGLTGADRLPAYTARGPRRDDGALKPDLTAPAEVVTTARDGTGGEGESFNGTSSATPHVAGAMALLRQVHPDWTVEELKALVVNTANPDLFTGPDHQGFRYGPGRVGGGRLDLAAASRSPVVAFDGEKPGAVGVSFGLVEVSPFGGFSLGRRLTVVNHGATTLTYQVTVQPTDPALPGLRSGSTQTISVPPASLFPPGFGTPTGQATAFVSLQVDGTQLKHPRDPAVSSVQDGVARQWLSEATAEVLLTPVSAPGLPPLRLPVHAVVRPVAAVQARDAVLTAPAGGHGPIEVVIAGTSLRTGPNFGPGADSTLPLDVVSLSKGLELQYVGPAPPAKAPDLDAQLKHVGVASDSAARNGDLAAVVVCFGIATYGSHVAPDDFTTRIEVLVDPGIDGDFTPVHTLTSTVLTSAAGYSNVYVPAFVLPGKERRYQPTGYLTNVYRSTDLDTNVFFSPLMLLPVRAADLGLTAGRSRFRYQVKASREGMPVSETPVLTYDPAAPGLTQQSNGLTEPYLDLDPDPARFTATSGFRYDYDGPSFAANRSLGLMLMHFHNAQRSPACSEALSLRP